MIYIFKCSWVATWWQ